MTPAEEAALAADIERVLVAYGVTVDGEWGSLRRPGDAGWDGWYTQFKADVLASSNADTLDAFLKGVL